MPKPKQKNLVISAPKLAHTAIRIVGTAPLVMNKFSMRDRELMKGLMEEGPRRGSKKAREEPDWDELFEGCIHREADEGWIGIPAPAFRCAMISACRTAGFVMTRAKLAFRIEADGFDADDGTPLVRLESEEQPERCEMVVRVGRGAAMIRLRPMWRRWAAMLRITYDEDMWTEQDTMNLLLRAGLQVGILEGRPDSKNSQGMGWGTFTIPE